jgi:hypothetical protein
MQLLSLGPVLAAWSSPVPGFHFPALLGSLPPQFLGAGVAFVLLCFIIGLPIGLLLSSIPLWIASKIVVSGYNATYGRAIITVLLNLGASFVLFFISTFLHAMVMASGDRSLSLLVSFGIMLLGFGVGIFIPSKVYEISALRALGLNVVSFLITLLPVGILIVGAMAVGGVAKFKEPLLASVQHLREAPEAVSPSSLPAPTSTPAPPPAPDHAAEIDGLLYTALHAQGSHLSPADREAIVRDLQQKLQAQRSNLQTNDAHAMAVYQNQLNRYMELLNVVKAERQAQLASRPAAPAAATQPQ